MSIWKRGDKRYVVRVAPFQSVTVHGPKTDAERVELELKRRRSLGDLYEAPPNLVGVELDDWLERIFATRNLKPRSIEWYIRCRRGWELFDNIRVCDLTRLMVEDRVAARAAKAPKSAGDELMILKQCLAEAKGRGQRVDAGIFAIPPVEHRPRRGRALSPERLYWFASWLPESSRRLVLLGGLVGARQNVWFNLTDDLLELDKRRMVAPADLQKNSRDHLIELTDIEVQLLREQLLVRAAGTRLVFPTPTGKRWTRHHFRDRVWLPAVTAAARADMAETGERRSVFGRFDAEGKLVDPFTFHLLRHTAGSLMAASGYDPAAAAERLGHTDGGALFLRTYRHLLGGERRRNADRFGDAIRAALAGKGELAEADEA